MIEFNTKTLSAFLCLFFAWALAGCNETIDARQLQDINGLFYKLNENEPFTGSVTNYILKGSRYYYKLSCNIELKKGQLNGAFLCNNDGIKAAEMEFENNAKKGVEAIWDTKTGYLFSKIEWKNGLRDGLEEQYNPQNGKLIEQIHWSENQKVGEEKKWDMTGEVLLEDLNWSDGKQTGFSKWEDWEETYIDGKRIDRKHYALIYGTHYDATLAAEVQLRGAGRFSYVLLGNSYLAWEEKYEDGKLVWRDPEEGSNFVSDVEDPHTDMN